MDASLEARVSGLREVDKEVAKDAFLKYANSQVSGIPTHMNWEQ